MTPTNVAISLREMSLVRCTLLSQAQLPLSGSIDDVVLRIGPGISSTKGWLQGTSRRSETATLRTA
jgi:hypothetical protein